MRIMLARLVKHCTGIAEVMVSNLVWLELFGLYFHCCEDLFHIHSLICSFHTWFSYIHIYQFSFLFCTQEPRLRNMREICLPLSTALRRLLSTALRFRRTVQFGTHPKICVATFYPRFGVDANSYITSYVTGK